jgi:hypothetical protein
MCPALRRADREIGLVTGNAGKGRRPAAAMIASAKASAAAGLVAVSRAEATASAARRPVPC